MNNDDGRPEFLIPVVPAALAILLGILLTLGLLAILVTENDLPAFLPWIDVGFALITLSLIAGFIRGLGT